MYKTWFIIFLFIRGDNEHCSLGQSRVSNEDLCFKDQNYFMNPTYKSRTSYFADDHRHCEADKAQEEVYQCAFNLASVCGAKVIADVGCGSGFKLLKYFSNFKTVGFEIEPNFESLKSRFPDRMWYYGNFSTSSNLPFFDIVICADVIEHLVDPDQLLNWLRHLDFKYLVISTPDKDKLPLYQIPSTQSQTGPPLNPHHIREWSFSEFKKYISHFFEIKEHFHNNTEWMTQVIIATKKSK